MPTPPVYLDDNGEPQGSVYLDESGEPVTARARAPARRGVGSDVARSSATGLHIGVAMIPGMFGDVQEIGRQAASVVPYWVARARGRSDDEARAEAQRLINSSRTFARARGMQLATTEDINNAALSIEPESVREWTNHTPETVQGEYVRTIGTFAPGALLPGSWARRAANSVVPAVTSETFGQVARRVAPEHETAARIIGGFTPMAAEFAASRLAAGGAQAGVLRNVRAELLDAGATPEEAGAVLRVMRNHKVSQNDIQTTQAVMSRTLNPETLQRMPTLSRQLGFDIEGQGRALESEFGPMTQGERTGNPNDRLIQSDYETGQGRARTRMANFNDERAPEIAQNARQIAERNLDPASYPGSAGDTAAENLRGVYAQMRELRRQLYRAADDMAERSGPINNNVGASLSESARNMIQRNRLGHVPEHERWLRAFDDLQRDIAAGRASWRDVHAVRRQLNEAYGVANPAERNVIREFKGVLDDFRTQFAPSEYNSAIANADRYSSEMSRMFGQNAHVELGPNGDFVGDTDIAGRRMETILGQDIDGRAVARMFLNSDGSPSLSGVTLSRRLRSINDDLRRTSGPAAETMAPNQQNRQAYSIRDGNRETVGSRGMAAGRETPGRYGVEQPTAELQAVREMVIDELVLNRLAARAAGDPIPAQAIHTRLRNFLRGQPGTRMADQLFTPSEVKELERLRDYFGRLQAPSGRAASGTPQGLARARQQGLDTISRILSRIAGVADRYGTGGLAGRLAEGWRDGMQESLAAQEARRITSRPGPYAPPQPVDLTSAPPVQRRLGGDPAWIAYASSRQEPQDRPVSAYSTDELERIAAGGN